MKSEIARMRKEAEEAQIAELRANYSRLSLESRIQIVMLSRKLVEEEEVNSLRLQFIIAYNKLNEEGKRIASAYLEALASNPKYRK